jgi:hypothetical protein
VRAAAVAAGGPVVLIAVEHHLLSGFPARIAPVPTAGIA